MITSEQNKNYIVSPKSTPPSFCHHKIMLTDFQNSSLSGPPYFKRVTIHYFVRKLACSVRCGSLAERRTRQSPKIGQEANAILHKTYVL